MITTLNLYNLFDWMIHYFSTWYPRILTHLSHHGLEYKNSIGYKLEVHIHGQCCVQFQRMTPLQQTYLRLWVNGFPKQVSSLVLHSQPSLLSCSKQYDHRGCPFHHLRASLYTTFWHAALNQLHELCSSDERAVCTAHRWKWLGLF